MAKNIELLLLQSVENLGIVGDVVKVKPGYARNYLLPHGIAEAPTDEKIESLKEARAKAQAEVEALRAAREELLGRMSEVKVTLVRSCNDQGLLYGSVTQRDLADALQEAGYDVGTRSVRMSQPIRRVGEHHIPIQFEKDLRTEITVVIESDQPLEERDEMEIDEEGNLVEPKKKKDVKKKDDAPKEEGAAETEAATEATA
ncbi:MAG: 50S ribosomal protein L9 [Phycisphaerales bacterium]|nr:MAG: 50S ribosomal protein L9 [Phycisphaerales bacterium]